MNSVDKSNSLAELQTFLLDLQLTIYPTFEEIIQTYLQCFLSHIYRIYFASHETSMNWERYENLVNHRISQ